MVGNTLTDRPYRVNTVRVSCNLTLYCVTDCDNANSEEEPRTLQHNGCFPIPRSEQNKGTSSAIWTPQYPVRPLT